MADQFYGGTPGGIGAGLAALTQLAGQAAAIKAAAGQNLGSLLSGLGQEHRARSFAREQSLFAADQNEQDRVQRETLFNLERADKAAKAAADLRENRIQSLLGIVGEQGRAAISEGFDPGAVIPQTLQYEQQLRSRLGAQPGVGAGALPEGSPITGEFRLGSGIGIGFGLGPPSQQASVPRGTQGGIGSFGQRLPPRPTAQQVFDQEVARAKAEIGAYQLSPEGKGLFVPIKVAPVDAFGWRGLPPIDLETQAIHAFPDYAPTSGIDGVEDRSKLDSLLRWLEKPQAQDVLNGAAVLKMRGLADARGLSPAAFDKALEQSFGQPGAMTKREAQSRAAAQLRLQMAEATRAQRPVSATVQGGSFGDVVSARRESNLFGPATAGALGPVELGGLLGTIGVDMANAGGHLRSAAAMGGMYKVVPVDGRLVILGAQDPTGEIPPPVGAQAELDALMRDPEMRARAEAKMGMSLKALTPAEAKDAGAARQVKGAGKQGAAPAASPKAEEARARAALPSAPAPAGGSSTIERSIKRFRDWQEKRRKGNQKSASRGAGRQTDATVASLFR